MKLLYLYSDSEFTPWRENINAVTVASLFEATPSHIQPYTAHFVGFTEEFAHFLRRFDLVFNVCYGFDNADQVEVAGWLDWHEIKHTASSYATQRVAMDKSSLPQLCQKVQLNTPRLVTFDDLASFSETTTFIAKYRYGSLHRDMLFFRQDNVPYEQLMLNDNYIIQPYLPGREFTVAIIPDDDGREFICLPPVEIIPDDGRKIYVAGQGYGTTLKQFQPELTPSLYQKITEGILALHQLIGIKGMSRTDIRVMEEEVYVLDINTMPNLDPKRSYLPAIVAHQGISMKELIERLIKSATYWYDKKRITETA
ncbi:MAG: ATP-grasp domain-containing protein [Runella zeae]